MKKMRDTKNPLPTGDANKAIAEFRNDFGSQYELIRFTDLLVQRAMGLVEQYKLRGYDAVQLATALVVSTQATVQGIAASGIPPLVLVASDADLVRAARTEGLTVDDPGAHP